MTTAEGSELVIREIEVPGEALPCAYCEDLSPTEKVGESGVELVPASRALNLCATGIDRAGAYVVCPRCGIGGPVSGDRSRELPLKYWNDMMGHIRVGRERMPEHLESLVFRFPLRWGYSEERCKELEHYMLVSRVDYLPEMASLTSGAASGDMPDNCLPHVTITATRSVMDIAKLTPGRVEAMLLKHIERDDSDKAEGEPPGL